MGSSSTEGRGEGQGMPCPYGFRCWGIRNPPTNKTGKGGKLRDCQSPSN